MALTFYDEDANTWSTPIGSGGFTWQYVWQAHPQGDGPDGFFKNGDYLVTATVEQTYAGQTCSAEATIRVGLPN